MASLQVITFQHKGTVQAGEGLCSTTFERLALNITYETWCETFLKGRIPRVPTDPEYVMQCRDLKATFPTINKSSVVESSDGVLLAWFIKGGMTFPWGRLGRELARLTVYAVATLIHLYKPPTAIEDDPRHKLDFKEESTKAKAANLSYGVYHFFFNRYAGGRNLTVHSEARPTNQHEAATVKAYLHQIKWQHILLSKWFKALAPVIWQRYWTAYQDRSQRGELGVLDAGEMGCFSSYALVIQAAVNPHKDKADVRDGVVLTTPSGWYWGGETSILEWGMRFAQQPGDILIAPMQVLTHMLDPIRGIRFGHVYTVHDEVLNPRAKPYMCDVCGLDYLGKGGLKQHKAERKDQAHRIARAQVAYDIHLNETGNPALTFDEFRNSWEDPADKRIPCEFPGCTEDFATSRAMAKHMKRIHGQKRGGKGKSEATDGAIDEAGDIEMEDGAELGNVEMEIADE